MKILTSFPSETSSLAFHLIVYAIISKFFITAGFTLINLPFQKYWLTMLLNGEIHHISSPAFVVRWSGVTTPSNNSLSSLFPLNMAIKVYYNHQFLPLEIPFYPAYNRSHLHLLTDIQPWETHTLTTFNITFHFPPSNSRSCHIQEQCIESLIEWASMAKQLHQSLILPGVEHIGVKQAATGLWSNGDHCQSCWLISEPT